MPHPFFAIPRPIVFGHRGACGECPENTLVSFERALAQGADVIETDVHRTRDGEIVVFHDADVTWIIRPRRAKRLRPSSSPHRSWASVTRSRVMPWMVAPGAST